MHCFEDIDTLKYYLVNVTFKVIQAQRLYAKNSIHKFLSMNNHIYVSISTFSETLADEYAAVQL